MFDGILVVGGSYFRVKVSYSLCVVFPLETSSEVGRIGHPGTRQGKTSRLPCSRFGAEKSMSRQGRGPGGVRCNLMGLIERNLVVLASTLLLRYVPFGYADSPCTLGSSTNLSPAALCEVLCFPGTRRNSDNPDNESSRVLQAEWAGVPLYMWLLPPTMA